MGDGLDAVVNRVVADRRWDNTHAMALKDIEGGRVALLSLVSAFWVPNETIRASRVMLFEKALHLWGKGNGGLVNSDFLELNEYPACDFLCEYCSRLSAEVQAD